MQLRKLIFILTLVFVLPLASQAQLDDAKIKGIATDFCNCFKPLQDSMSKEAVDLLIKAGMAADPDSAMKAAFDEIKDPEKKMSIAMEFMKLSALEDEGNEVTVCLNSLQSKYPEYVENDTEIMEKLVKELMSNKDCRLTAAFMKLGLAAQKKKAEGDQ